MSLIEDVKSIEVQHLAIWSLLFLSTLAPGMLIAYMYQPNAFKELETIKLLILSISISLPIPTLNIFLSAITNGLKNEEFLGHLILNIIISFVLMYASILAAYLWHLNFRGLLATIGGLEVIFLAFLCFDKFNVRKKS